MPNKDRIVSDHNIMLGKPVIRNTRITVELIIRKFAEGSSHTDLLKAYPSLEPEDISAALTYASEVISNEDEI